MAYLNNIYSADPNKAFVYKISDDKVENRVSTGTKPNGICVSTDQTTVLVTNMDDNTVSIFRNGSKVRDWPVGTQPWGVCQGIAHDNDPGTPYYVSNYTDNTVTKFFISSTGVVTEGKTYSVGKGPRGLCSDPTGNIYVANYNSSTVSVIGYVTDLVGGEIEVASSPQQICSTTNGDIYVACSTSGVVTKIVSNNKTTDITVGRKPMGICVDKNNAIWVTNYKSNTICKIINDEIALTTTITGYPAFIDCDNNNNLWVYSHETKKLIKLNKTGVIIEEIETDYNPSAYGDFTGMQASMIVGNVCLT